jgi:hypothetical protein
MANCSDNSYVIKYTDQSKGTITITKSSLVTDKLDIALVGKTRLDYGEIFDENVLHLLEGFSCPSIVNTGGDATVHPFLPDRSVAFGSLLDNPTLGQRWFDSTNNRTNYYDGSGWKPLMRGSDIVGVAGVIAHGQLLPQPVDDLGNVFDYSECSWTVSPFDFIDGTTYDEIEYMRCYTSAGGLVTMQYRFVGESSLRAGYANYMIIGIRGNHSIGSIATTPYVVPSPTPGISPTPTPTISVTPTHTPPVTPTITPTHSVTATISPTPTPSHSVGSSPTPTPTRTPTHTPTPTVTHTPTHTPTPTPTRTPSPTPSVAPPLAINVFNGNGTPYTFGFDVGMAMVEDIRGSASGCGTGGALPHTVITSLDDGDNLYFEVTGGYGPYVVTLDTWTIVTRDTHGATFSIERFTPESGYGFSGSAVIGDPINNPTWTWNGLLLGGKIVFAGTGICGTQEIYTDGTVVVHAVDSHGHHANTTVAWRYQRYNSEHPGPGCVDPSSFVSDGVTVEQLAIGDAVNVMDMSYGMDAPVFSIGEVRSIRYDMQKAVRLHMKTGATLRISETTPVVLRDGSSVWVRDMHEGMELPVQYTNRPEFGSAPFWDVVTHIENIGEIKVALVNTGNKCYAAGETSGAYIYTHNVDLKP